jgi:hypothetical protein
MHDHEGVNSRATWAKEEMLIEKHGFFVATKITFVFHNYAIV